MEKDYEKAIHDIVEKRLFKFIELNIANMRIDDLINIYQCIQLKKIVSSLNKSSFVSPMYKSIIIYYSLH